MVGAREDTESCPQHTMSNTSIGRLNGVIYLVTVFEELSRHKSFLVMWQGKPRNASFVNRTSEATDIVVRYSAAIHMVPSAFFLDLRSSMWFPPLCCTDFSLCSSKALWLFYSLGQALSFLLICCRTGMGKLFGERAASLGYELTMCCIFKNLKNLASIQVQVFILFYFLKFLLEALMGHREQCGRLQFAHPSCRIKFTCLFFFLSNILY